jgi:hypothetical protein
MPLSAQELEKKTNTLLTNPSYRLPNDLSPTDRAIIMSRIDQQENNRYIAAPPFGYGNARDRTKVYTTIGGKRKSRILKKRKSRKQKTRK